MWTSEFIVSSSGDLESKAIHKPGKLWIPRDKNLWCKSKTGSRGDMEQVGLIFITFLVYLTVSILKLNIWISYCCGFAARIRALKLSLRAKTNQ